MDHAAVTSDVADHPAVEAWIRTGTDRLVPERILVLKEARRRSVYRLPGVGPGGGTVIAKRSRIPVARLEAFVYENVLPHLPVPAPRYYGSWFDGPRGWILLEDVGGEPFAHGNAEHRRLASRWVGTLHVSAVGLEAGGALPDAGPTQYLEHLVQGREKIRDALERWQLRRGEAEVLEALVAQCEAIETDWQVIETSCHGAPDTLVHGDVQPKNIFLKEEREGRILRIIDWEMVGFGCPAADLNRIDLDEYWAVVRSAWPRMTFDRLTRLRDAGRLFQTLAEVHWLSEWFKDDSERGRREAVSRMRPLVRRLSEGHPFHPRG